jgi:histidinol-phosphate phosphatase family protein
MIMFDRDGVLNEDRADYVKTPGELVLVPGAARAVARLNLADVTTVVVTNQGGIGRGILDEDTLARIHDKLCEDLAHENARLDHILFCPDHPDQPDGAAQTGAGHVARGPGPFRGRCCCQRPWWGTACVTWRPPRRWDVPASWCLPVMVKKLWRWDFPKMCSRWRFMTI